MTPSQTASAPEELIFHLAAHSGKPAIPLVFQGDLVKVGQLIAKADGHDSANIHSSISGEVKSLSDYPHPNGFNLPSIIIKNDHKNTKVPFIPLKSIKGTSKEELIQRIFDAGIVEMDGSMIPTHLKFNSQKKVNEIIINGAECEPYLTCDNRLMVEQTKYIFLGIDILLEILKPSKVYIAVQDNKPEAIYALRNYGIRYKNVKIVTLPTRYPIGADKVLVRYITKNRSSKLPHELGVLVFSMASTAQIGLSVTTGSPLTERLVTLSGDLIDKKMNIRVKLGTPIKHLLSELTEEKAAKHNPFRIILGGPLTGLSQHNTDVPIMKNTSGLLVLKEQSEPEQDCIRCGRCIDCCPMFLIPTLVIKNAVQIEECIECGACSYHCPSKINLVSQIHNLKNSKDNS